MDKKSNTLPMNDNHYPAEKDGNACKKITGEGTESQMPEGSPVGSGCPKTTIKKTK